MVNNKKGFSNGEILVVVAIIAILIIIIFPLLTKIIEKARESADLANIRGACSQMSVIAMLDEEPPEGFKRENNSIHTCVECMSRINGWQTESLELEDGLVQIVESYCDAPNVTKPYISITYDMESGKFTFQSESKAIKPVYN